MRFYYNKRYLNDITSGNSFKNYTKRFILFPIKYGLRIFYYFFKGLYNVVDIFKGLLKNDYSDKFKKMRALRYINKNIGKLEEYSSIRAVANVRNFFNLIFKIKLGKINSK